MVESIPERAEVQHKEEKDPDHAKDRPPILQSKSGSVTELTHKAPLCLTGLP